MKKLLIIIASVSVVLGGLALVLLLSPRAATPTASTENTSTTEPTERTPTVAEDIASPMQPSTAAPAEEAPSTPVAQGRYETYTETAPAATGYTQTVLFFYAPWCPECRAFDTAINDSAIPDGVQVLRVDYDSSTELRQKHGVTLQSTFVEVNASGDQTALWVGYGKDKSLATILDNL